MAEKYVGQEWDGSRTKEQVKLLESSKLFSLDSFRTDTKRE